MSIPLTNWTLKPAAPCGLMLEATDIAGKPTMLAHLYAHTDSHDIDMDVAHLIASAPELLEAMRATLALAEAYYRALPDDGAEQDHYMATVIAPTRAAIAKAEGRTP